MVDLQTTATWESAIADWPRTRGHRLLRAYADELNARLAETWLVKGPRPHRLLKTDLFDEAVGSGLYPCLRELADEVHGIDVADAVVAAAASRYPELEAEQADVRRLPLPTERSKPSSRARRSTTSTRSPSSRQARRARARARAGWAPARDARQRVQPARLPPKRDSLALARERPPRPLLRRRDMQRGGLENRLARAGLLVERTATLMHVPRMAVLGLGAVSSVRPSHLGALLSAERLGNTAPET